MTKMQSILLSRTAPMIGYLPAYANTLTNLIPSLYEGLDIVSRELVGYLPSIARSATTERAAVGQSVTYHVAPAANVSDVTPSNTVPNPTDQTIGSGNLTITKARVAEFGVIGEEVRGLDNNGAGWSNVQADMFAQGVRALVNEFEDDVAAAAYVAASRAYGTAGTTPFASGVGDSAQLRKILDDNGAPLTGRSLIIDTAAGAALRTNTQLTKANEASSIMTLRQGELLDMHGFSIKETGQGQAHTKGTGASYAVNNGAGYAIGATTIAIDTGSGTVLAGDVVTFAGDTNKYVVAQALSGGNIVLAAPGLRKALADGVLMTVGNSYTANVGFSQNALVMAARPPALPPSGDLAVDSMMLTDERSGITFEVRVYPLYRKVRYEVGLAWGVKAVKPEHIALLLG